MSAVSLPATLVCDNVRSFTMTHTRDWNAASYARTAAPVEAFGQKLLDRLELRGDES